METTTQNHEHNGIDSKKLNAALAILNAPQAAITDPTGGATIDTEARTAIIAIIDALQALNLIR